VTSSRELPNPIAYIPPQCFTRMVPDEGGPARNPCYVCHTRSTAPNYVDDGNLQLSWALPPVARDNPWTNLFSPAILRAAPVSDGDLLAYVRTSNYFGAGGSLAFAERLRHVPPEWDLNHDGKWGGYMPDAGLQFDDAGFDHLPDGSPSGWRAFAYHPFPGTFFPTNGSMDDVLIRLDPAFREDANGQQDTAIYAINLAIVEALIKQVDVPIPPTDEKAVGVDLDLDGTLGRATRVAFDAGDGKGSTRMRYVGRARVASPRLPIAPGLFPPRTELLHSVRYLDVTAEGEVTMAPRMKELRYAKKVNWLSYEALKGKVVTEALEQRAHDGTTIVRWDFERGIYNGQGWIYQGFIEDRDGSLRPQSFEESAFCAGCHGGIGATTDGVFSFARKLSGLPSQKGKGAGGWFHWSQHDLHGIPERRRRDGSFEYARYLAENGAGDELRENEEVIARFFDAQGHLVPAAVARLHDDVSTLLLPSPGRALALDRAYKAVVTEQSYSLGRDAVLAPAKNVYSHPPIGEKTGVPIPIEGR
jgi:hypothetical protein